MKFKCGSCGNVQAVYSSSCQACNITNALRPYQQRTETLRADRLPEASIKRLATGIAPFDKIINGGLPYSTSTLMVGAPGAGKSTLCAYILKMICEKGVLCAYASVEEGIAQMSDRAKRMGIYTDKLLFISSSSLKDAKREIENFGAQVAVYDSVQIFGGDIVKDYGSPSIRILISQVNSDGGLHGPMSREHNTDCSIYLKEKDDSEGKPYTTVRVEKNRNGPGAQICHFRLINSGIEFCDDPAKKEEEKANEES